MPRVGNSGRSRRASSLARATIASQRDDRGRRLLSGPATRRARAGIHGRAATRKRGLPHCEDPTVRASAVPRRPTRASAGCERGHSLVAQSSGWMYVGFRGPGLCRHSATSSWGLATRQWPSSTTGHRSPRYGPRHRGRRHVAGARARRRLAAARTRPGRRSEGDRLRGASQREGTALGAGPCRAVPCLLDEGGRRLGSRSDRVP